MILVERRKTVKQFKNQLKELFESGTPILTLFRMYLAFLYTFADRPGTPTKYRLALWTSWQIKDMEMSIYNAKIDVSKIPLETAWLYTRRGGKTRGLTIIAVFFTLLDKQVAWRAPHGEQLSKAGFWFAINPFVKKVLIRSTNIVRVYNSLEISIAPMTAGRVAGGDCDILIYDEGGWIPKRLKAYEFYLASRPMVSNSEFKHIINASTPARDTAFQDEWDEIEIIEAKYDIKLTSLHDCEDCPWIPPEFIASESAKYPKWYIEMNYYCLWTVPYGSVFEKIIEVSDPKYPQFNSKFLYDVAPTKCGVDHNKGDRNNPHYLVTIHYDDNFIYVLDEYTFTNLTYLLNDKWRHISMEIEDGLFNSQFTEQEKSLGVKAIYQEFNESLKMERVQTIREKTIIIDKNRAPLTYQNLLNAAYDKASRLVKLEKRTDQHGLDCVIHGMHPEAGPVHYKRLPAYRGSRPVFQKRPNF